ncbi:MAG TPA: hypothetical protein VFQ53_17175 [Kofleriaceae bacterium]|nr:hypothetical protein [Kofleriaceae bacterium]
MVALHPVLLAAMQGARRRGLDNPLHATTPSPPWLAPKSLAELVLWLADRVLDPAEPPEAGVLARARRWLATPSEIVGPQGHAKYPVERLSVAMLAERTAWRAHKNPAATVTAAKAAARLALTLVRAVPAHELRSAASLLRAMDERIFCVEAGAFLAEHDAPADRVREVLFRRAGEHGRLGLVVVRLDPDGQAGADHGVLLKLHGRYRWFAGSRADALATVPDAVLDEALPVVEARERMLG